jgi:hypothetical protein
MTPDAYCYRCGTPLEATSRFCRECGTRRVDDPTVQSATSPPPPGAADQPLSGIDPYSVTPPPSTPRAAAQPPPADAPQGYVAQPPAQSPPAPHRRVWVAAAAAGAGVLFIIAVVLVLALSSSGGNGVHTATVVTVTTTSVSAPPHSTLPAASLQSPSSPPTSTNASPPSRLVVARLLPYDGARFTASIPAGWTIDENEVQKPGYIESKWTNPADTADYLLIDESPATRNLTLEQDASSVHQALQEASGYHQLFYGPGDLTGVESWMWIFRISGDQRIDYFFNRCTSGFGVLGSTLTSRFSQLRATFRNVARSVQVSCR